jgi:hypothetical protein
MRERIPDVRERRAGVRERIPDGEIGREDLRRAGGMVFRSGDFDRSLVSYQSRVDESGAGFGVYHVSSFWEVAQLQLPKMTRKIDVKLRQAIFYAGLGPAESRWPRMMASMKPAAPVTATFMPCRAT